MTRLPFFAPWVASAGFLAGYYIIAPLLAWLGV